MPSGKYQRKFKPIKDRLLAKTVKTDSCWIWTGSTNHFGHGCIMADRNIYATRHLLKTHRVSWEVHIGPIPDGMCILHRCDVPRCVNPDHLFVGTKADNTADMMMKGRNGFKRDALSDDVKSQIRSAIGTQDAIARQFGISQGYVSVIRRKA